jgi:hypothetical protein
MMIMKRLHALYFMQQKCYRMNHLPSTHTNFEVMLKIRRWCDVACCCNVISQWDANGSTSTRINDRTWNLKVHFVGIGCQKAVQEAEVGIQAQKNDQVWKSEISSSNRRHPIAIPWKRSWGCMWTLNSGLRDEDERYWLSTRVIRGKSVLRRTRKKSCSRYQGPISRALHLGFPNSRGLDQKMFFSKMIIPKLGSSLTK